MSSFFKPYEGSRPYLFISYAHLHSAAVVDSIRLLHDRGWRLWYDEGIPAGGDWPANIARHMQGCERVIFFLSARAMESNNCYSEMRTAARLGKPVLVVRLEDCPLQERWRDLLEGREQIGPFDSPEDRAAAILASGFVTRRYRRRWTEGIHWRALSLAASLLLFLAAAAALGGLLSGRWSPIPPAPSPPAETAAPTPTPEVLDLGEAERYFALRFPDAQQKRAIHRALGLDPEEEVLRGQMAQLRELYFCGGTESDSLEGIAFDSRGRCSLNGAGLIQGKVRDLTNLRYALRLESLGLVCQPLEDLSPLAGHVLLRELSLAGSTVEELSALRELPSLEILHLEHTGVRDLSVLDALPNLKTVTVSLDMLPLRWSENAEFQVVLVRDI